MRILCIAVLSVCVVAATSCIRRGPAVKYRKLTGTCQGACDHYLSCKAMGGNAVKQPSQKACEAECSEVFSGPETLLAFESLSCEDAIGFVEGQSGRAPGEPPPAESVAVPQGP